MTAGGEEILKAQVTRMYPDDDHDPSSSDDNVEVRTVVMCNGYIHLCVGVCLVIGYSRRHSRMFLYP